MRKLFLEDIIDFTYESAHRDKISTKHLYHDGFDWISEVNSWRLDEWLPKYISDCMGCVYFLLSNNEVVYIGQTKRSTRIRSHIRRGLEFNSLRFMPTKSDMHLKLEKKLLDTYVTKYNRTGMSKMFDNYSNSKHLEKEKIKFIDKYNMLIFGKEYSTKDIYKHFNYLSKPSIDKKLANKNLFSRVKQGVYIKQINK